MLESYLDIMNTETLKVDLCLLPGGKMPVRMTDGAVGYDVSLRAIVSPIDMDEENTNLRKTLFDFSDTNKVSTKLKEKGYSLMVNGDTDDERVVGFVLKPGASVLVGIGFLTAFKLPWFYWVAPRSGLAGKYQITVTNGPGTVDSDYRGEAGVLVHNEGDKGFILKKDMRIAQIVFQRAEIPEINLVESAVDLPETSRGSGGFGSTGIYEKKDS